MGIRVLLADDHSMMREGLRLILERDPRIEAVYEAPNGRAALEMLDTLRPLPHVVVMDVAMPELNGIDTTRKIKAENPQIGVIALSMFADKRYVIGMLEVGASGYVLKSGAAAELVQAIETVSQGRKYLSPEIAELVVNGFLNRENPVAHPEKSVLGDREREVLQLIAEGYSSKEIAQKLDISPITADTHRRNIMKKLELHSIAELTKYAIREGISSMET
jgi:DNA-binding NarL/FixJ family response regulator